MPGRLASPGIPVEMEALASARRIRPDQLNRLNTRNLARFQGRRSDVVRQDGDPERTPEKVG
jgi:hypothetical protein